MHREENNQYFSVNNGQYYVKRTIEDYFYLLKESGEWKYDPSLSDEFYDILSGGEHVADFKDFISPVFILNAVNNSIKSGKEEPVNTYEV